MLQACFKLPSLVAGLGIHPWYAYKYGAESMDQKVQTGIITTNISQNNGRRHSVIGAHDDQCLCRIEHKQQKQYQDQRHEQYEQHVQCQSGQCTQTSWVLQMDRLLSENKTAFVGEVGLDYKARTPETKSIHRDEQQRVFYQCLELAAKHNRPVSIHCVKAWEDICQIFKHRSSQDRQLPPAISLHSFTGSCETAIRLLRYARETDVDIFFGISKAVSMRSKKISAVISAIPLEHLLVESDERNSEKVDEDISTVIELITETKQILSYQNAITSLNQNALRWAAAIIS